MKLNSLRGRPELTYKFDCVIARNERLSTIQEVFKNRKNSKSGRHKLSTGGLTAFKFAPLTSSDEHSPNIISKNGAFGNDIEYCF